MAKTLLPVILWAQRSNATVPEKNVVYLTVSVTDVEKPKISLKADSLEFEGTNETDTYHVKLDFYEEIDVDKSTRHFNDRGVFLVLRKSKMAAEYWPRLTKQTTRYPFVKTDFDKWVDEDEQEEETTDPAAGLGDMGDLGGDFDFSQFTQQLGDGGNGTLADRFSPEMLQKMSEQQQGELADDIAEESLDSIGERINPVEDEADGDESK